MGKITAEQVTEGLDASGLTIMVTGGTNGIGLETVRVLAKRGAHVFLAARNLSAADKVKEDIIKKIPSARIDLLKLELSSLEAVRTAAQEFLALNVPLNVLVNNAGIFPVLPFKLSPDGIELTFATNYLGPFLFTHLLLDKMKLTAKESRIEGRIVNVSSQSHEMWGFEEGIRFDKLNKQEGYDIFKMYGQSKLAQVLYTKELAKRLQILLKPALRSKKCIIASLREAALELGLKFRIYSYESNDYEQEEGANVTVNVLHPGEVKTNITSTAPLWIKPFLYAYKWLYFTDIPEGAATQTYVAISPDVVGVTGKYFDNGKETQLKDKRAVDEELQKKLWDFSMKLIST